jgi:adenylate cyclase
MRYLGRLSGIHLQYFVGAAAPFLILGLSRLPLIIALVSAGFALHITSWFLYPPDAALIAVDADMLDALYVTAASTTFVLIAATVYYAYSLAERAQAETDTLLRNILPESVVDRLKAAPDAAIADSFEETSVLFADLKGFVPIAHTLGPQKTVALLNELVSEFDTLVATHGAEKIKTIGDAYMVAAGVPEPASDHADRLALLALDMLDVIERVGGQHDLDLQMRIGISSGPVMAGIIGTKRLTYDVWGDTVNMAARLENLSEPGRIQISTACKERLTDTIATEPRGELEIKGVGRQDTWFLVPRSTNGSKDHQPSQPKAGVTS